MAHKPKLRDSVRNKIRLTHGSIGSERNDIDSMKRFILFHHKRYPASISMLAVCALLSHLTMDQKVAVSTQNQALSLCSSRI
jgi:Phage integrase, N-terminal SAM-like domain